MKQPSYEVAPGRLNVTHKRMPQPSKLPELRWPSVDRVSYLERLMSMFTTNRHH